MLRYGRLGKLFGRNSGKRVSTAWSLASIAAAGIAIGGCSADIMRFDAPALGYRSSENPPPQPIHSDGSLFEQRPESANYDSTPAPSNYQSAPYTPPRQQYAAAPAASSGRLQTTRLADGGPAVRERRDQYRQTPYRQSNYSTQATTTGEISTPLTASNVTKPAVGGANFVVVQSGDTLYDLARRNGVSVSEIKQANGLSSNVIRPGQRLSLGSSRAGNFAPAQSAPRFETRPTESVARAPSANDVLPLGDGQTYTVQRGDSLYAISRRTGIKVATLKELNGIEDARRMRPGMVLQLGGSPAASPAATNREYDTAARAPRAERTSVDINGGRQPIILNPSSESRSVPAASRITDRPAGAVQNAAPRRQASADVSNRAPAPSATGKFRWPARGRIIRGFGSRADGSKNDGINIAVPVGTDVHAAEAGVVAYAGDELKGYGNLILVRHESGFVTAYAHSSRMLVRRGDNVRRGQVIAKAGKTGEVSRPQIHFELRKGAKPIDPIPYLDRL